MPAANGSGKRIAVVAAVACGIAIVSDLVAGAATDGRSATEAAPTATPARPRPSRPVVTAPSAASGIVRLDRLDAARGTAGDGDAPAGEASLFDAVDWRPPAPQVAASAPPPVEAPPKPVAPPFPYAYMGALLEDGVRTVFLTKAERLVAVKVGDTVDGAYRVDQLTDRQLRLTYLPLEQPLVVSLGGPR